MKTTILAYFLSLILLLVFDGIWLLFVIKNFIEKNIGHLMADSAKIWPAIIFYPVYALGILVFIVLPAINNNTDLWKVFLLGGLLGLVAYGAYDFTNHATLKDWPLAMTIVDIFWGISVTGTVALLTVYLTRIL